MRPLRVAAAIGVVAVLAGCTSTVRGFGRMSGTGSGPGSTAPPAADIERTHAVTAIGDPVTADLCTALGRAALRGLGGGLKPSFDARQYPPGCSATLRHGRKRVLALSVFAGRGPPTRAAGRTTREAHGHTVYSYEYDSATGDCAREIMARRVVLTVDAYPLRGAGPSEALSCSASDAMATRAAAVLAAGGVPRLALADPSLSDLDACAIVRKAAITALPAFADGKVLARGFKASCELAKAHVFLFFNFAIADAAQPRRSSSTTVAGHRLYETAARADYCAYVSTQGRTTTGGYEQVAVYATAPGSAPPAKLCDETAAALARYLTAAGLG